MTAAGADTDAASTLSRLMVNAPLTTLMLATAETGTDSPPTLDRARRGQPAARLAERDIRQVVGGEVDQRHQGVERDDRGALDPARR